MAPKKKPVLTPKTTKTKKKQPLAAEVELQQRQEELELINKELARSQVELETAYRQYTDLYDFAPVGYLTLTRNGAIHQVNLAGADLLGVDHNKVTRLRLATFVSNESRPAFNAFLGRLLSGEGKETCELVFEKKGKGLFWARLEATCFEGGDVCRAMLADITERKQMEQALQESEWRTRIVTELTTDYIFVVDVDPSGILKFRWASDNLFRITGRTIEEAATSDTWGSMIDPDDRTRFFGFITQILSTAETGELECRAVYKHGQERWIRIFARPQVGEGNRVTTVVGAIQDITERKRAEEQLQESEKRFRNLVETTSDWIWEIDANGVYTYASPRIRDILGFESSEIIGKRPDDFMPPEEAQRVLGLFTSIFATRSQISNLENKNLHKDGRVIILETSGVPIVDNDGVFCGYRGIDRDITERKQVEMKLHYMKEGLEAANTELQAALVLQQQLAHTDELTGINNRRYLYELAEHEFEIATRYRQPLSAIMFDLDHFKEVNDVFGHAVGDQVLQYVTQAALVELRSADVIGRYGGEEFVIMLPMTNAHQAYPLAERIRVRVMALRVPTEKGDASVTLSIGIVEMLHSPQTDSADDLIRRADEAMYAAKQAGRNRTEIGNQEIV